MSNVLMDISLHADTQHRAVDLSSYQFIREIIDTSELTIFEAIFRWDTWRRLSTAIHNPMRVTEKSNWLRYSWFCIRSSARSDLLLVSHELLLTTSFFSQASWLFTPISSKFCIICCCYVCFGLLMQISLADYSAYVTVIFCKVPV